MAATPANEKRAPGELVYICGPMFSGKSTELLRRAGVYAQHAANRVVVLLNATDTRNGADGRAVFTHSGERQLAERCRVVRYQGVLVADMVPPDATHVLLDEAQMLSAEAVDAVLWRELVLARGLHVTAAGLMFKASWCRGPAHATMDMISALHCDAAVRASAGCPASAMFPAAMRLNERADKTVELRAICACGAKTRFTAYTDPARQAASAAPDIGGADKYVALCNVCMEHRYPVSAPPP